MQCYRPLDAWQNEDGEIVFRETKHNLRSLRLPCGQCIGCRLERSRQWAVRCMHEAACYEQSSFVTLTYDEEHLPYAGDLVYHHFQDFNKRVRRRLGPFRFYMCGEYGELHGRPHFHSCMFGVGFPDRVFFKRLPSGFDIYTSESLRSLWPFGHSSVGDVTFESAAYVARYCVKKVTGPDAAEHYLRVDEYGEAHWLTPEFNRMSLGTQKDGKSLGGIGMPWFERFRSDVFPHDHVIVRGRRSRPPRYYYEKFLASASVKDATAVESERLFRASELEMSGEGLPDRLRAREVVTRARLAFKRRSLI